MLNQKPEKNISADMTLPSKYIDVKGTKLHYVEQGSGDPILFLHGIPASVYLWRNVIPIISEVGRTITIDFTGYGKSQVPISCRYDSNNQYLYLEGFIEKMGLKSFIHEEA